MLRPLCGVERLAALGFPLPDTHPEPFSQADWDLIDDTGNCFPLPAIKLALKPVADYLKDGAPLPLQPWNLDTRSWSWFFTKLGLEVPPIPSRRAGEQGARR